MESWGVKDSYSCNVLLRSLLIVPDVYLHFIDICTKTKLALDQKMDHIHEWLQDAYYHANHKCICIRHVFD